MKHDVCMTSHRNYNALARCEWPAAAWVRGEGPYVVVSLCPAGTITLHANVDDAFGARDFMDLHGCGGRCEMRHEVRCLDDLDAEFSHH